MIRYLLLVVVSASLSACGAEPTPPPASNDASPDGATTTVVCTNEERGFAISYPEGWHTNPVTVTYRACSMFDPEPITAEDLAELSDRGRQDPPDFSPAIWATRFLPGQGYAQGGEKVNQEELTNAGRDAARWEELGVPGGIMPPGHRGYAYRIFLEDGAYFMAWTRSFGPDEIEEYERIKTVLDEMISTVQIDAR